MPAFHCREMLFSSFLWGCGVWRFRGFFCPLGFWFLFCWFGFWLGLAVAAFYAFLVWFAPGGGGCCCVVVWFFFVWLRWVFGFLFFPVLVMARLLGGRRGCPGWSGSCRCLWVPLCCGAGGLVMLVFSFFLLCFVLSCGCLAALVFALALFFVVWPLWCAVFFRSVYSPGGGCGVGFLVCSVGSGLFFFGLLALFRFLSWAFWLGPVCFGLCGGGRLCGGCLCFGAGVAIAGGLVCTCLWVCGVLCVLSLFAWWCVQWGCCVLRAGLAVFPCCWLFLFPSWCGCFFVLFGWCLLVAVKLGVVGGFCVLVFFSCWCLWSFGVVVFFLVWCCFVFLFWRVGGGLVVWQCLCVFALFGWFVLFCVFFGVGVFFFFFCFWFGVLVFVGLCFYRLGRFFFLSCFLVFGQLGCLFLVCVSFVGFFFVCVLAFWCSWPFFALGDCGLGLSGRGSWGLYRFWMVFWVLAFGLVVFLSCLLRSLYLFLFFGGLLFWFFFCVCLAGSGLCWCALCFRWVLPVLGLRGLAGFLVALPFCVCPRWLCRAVLVLRFLGIVVLVCLPARFVLLFALARSLCCVRRVVVPARLFFGRVAAFYCVGCRSSLRSCGVFCTCFPSNFAFFLLTKLLHQVSLAHHCV